MITQQAIDEIYSGERKGCHSSRHWHNVATAGTALALTEGGDLTVVRLFAMYHDCRRHNDAYDPGHGSRAAQLAKEHYEQGFLRITDGQLAVLMTACEGHTIETHHSNITVQCCWDADRLDLPRVGIVVNNKFLNTSTARTLADGVRGIYRGECDCGN